MEKMVPEVPIVPGVTLKPDLELKASVSLDTGASASCSFGYSGKQGVSFNSFTDKTPQKIDEHGGNADNGCKLDGQEGITDGQIKLTAGPTLGFGLKINGGIADTGVYAKADLELSPSVTVTWTSQKYADAMKNVDDCVGKQLAGDVKAGLNVSVDIDLSGNFQLGFEVLTYEVPQVDTKVFDASYNVYDSDKTDEKATDDDKFKLNGDDVTKCTNDVLALIDGAWTGNDITGGLYFEQWDLNFSHSGTTFNPSYKFDKDIWTQTGAASLYGDDQKNWTAPINITRVTYDDDEKTFHLEGTSADNKKHEFSGLSFEMSKTGGGVDHGNIWIGPANPLKFSRE
jgi:hypothetical protein